ncbi:hypothetical protein ACFLY8_05830, partial [Halobacteriota archaeon]
VSGLFNVLKAETTLNIHFTPPKISSTTQTEKSTVESVEIGYTFLRDWGSQPLRYDIDYTLDTVIYVKDKNDMHVNTDAELIFELYERKTTDDGSSETAIGGLLDRWERTIREKSIVGESGGHEFRLQYSNTPRDWTISPILDSPYPRPYGVEYGILQVTLITPNGKRFYVAKDNVSLEIGSEEVMETIGC